MVEVEELLEKIAALEEQNCVLLAELAEQRAVGVDLRTVLAFEAGQQVERDEIVAWLRKQVGYAAFAEQIEQGRHRFVHRGAP